jgi:hypothetical protein
MGTIIEAESTGTLGFRQASRTGLFLKPGEWDSMPR